MRIFEKGVILVKPFVGIFLMNYYFLKNKI